MPVRQKIPLIEIKEWRGALFVCTELFSDDDMKDELLINAINKFIDSLIPNKYENNMINMYGFREKLETNLDGFDPKGNLREYMIELDENQEKKFLLVIASFVAKVLLESTENFYVKTPLTEEEKNKKEIKVSSIDVSYQKIEKTLRDIHEKHNNGECLQNVIKYQNNGECLQNVIKYQNNVLHEMFRACDIWNDEERKGMMRWDIIGVLMPIFPLPSDSDVKSSLVELKKDPSVMLTSYHATSLSTVYTENELFIKIFQEFGKEVISNKCLGECFNPPVSNGPQNK